MAGEITAGGVFDGELFLVAVSLWFQMSPSLKSHTGVYYPVERENGGCVEQKFALKATGLYLTVRECNTEARVCREGSAKATTMVTFFSIYSFPDFYTDL